MTVNRNVLNRVRKVVMGQRHYKCFYSFYSPFIIAYMVDLRTTTKKSYSTNIHITSVQTYTFTITNTTTTTTANNNNLNHRGLTWPNITWPIIGML